MPTLTIDGLEVTVEAGTSVLRAAEQAGVEIPHFCYHPYLSVAGNCRMCLVEIEGQRKLMTSCSTPAADGMVVKTKSDAVREAVRGVLEFELVNHPIDCPICDQAGECSLQDYYMLYGLHESRISQEEKVAKGKALDLGPIMLDQERCVLCSRCVRYTDEVSSTGELYIFNRGNRSEIRSFDSRPLTGLYTGNLADLCPVGALTSREFRFRKRVWFLESTKSLCPGCATGCNCYLDHAEGKIYRMRPRENSEVNKSWLCDPGRALYAEAGATSRLAAARKRGRAGMAEVSLDEALEAAAELLAAGPGPWGLVLSPRLSIEDLYMAGRLAAKIGAAAVTTVFSIHQADPAAAEDSILRSRDPFPNTRGARLLLRSSSIDEFAMALRDGKIANLLVVSAEDLDGTDLLKPVADAVAGLNAVLLISSRETSLDEAASIILPSAIWAERDGTWLSGKGRLQRFQRAVMAPGIAEAPFQLLARLRRLLGDPSADVGAASLWKDVASEVPALCDLTYARIGSAGIPVDIEETPVSPILSSSREGEG